MNLNLVADPDALDILSVMGLIIDKGNHAPGPGKGLINKHTMGRAGMVHSVTITHSRTGKPGEAR